MPPGNPFQPNLMFAGKDRARENKARPCEPGKARAYPRVEHMRVLHSGRLWPYPQALFNAEKVFQGQIL